MKILFRDGSNHNSVKLINMIRDKLNPEFSAIISSRDYADKIKLNGKETILDYYSLLDGFHKEDLILPPLDEKILLLLSPYVGEIFRAMGRNGAFYYSYPKREELFLRQVKYWNWALDKYEIDLFLGFAVPHFSFELVIYYLCKIKKIKTLFTWHTSVAPYMHFVENIDSIGEEVCLPYNKCLEMLIDEDISNINLPQDMLRNFEMHSELKGDRTPFYMGNRDTKLSNIKRRLNATLSYLVYIKSIKKSVFSVIMLKIFKNLDTGNYIKAYNKSCSKITFGNQEKFIYVPLHLQPEATTCPLGGIYANQLLMISMLSFYLPNDICLYVKENPKQNNSDRSIVFLLELLKLNNVKLVSMQEDTFNLIENSIAIATVTGTAAWEALLRRKPVIIFGKHINKYAPSVYCVRDNIECKNAIYEIINRPKDESLLKKIKIFMLAMDKICFKSKVLSEIPISDNEIIEDLNRTCEAISNKISKISN